ncbi:MAG: hypothetical protein KC488_06920, partial [Candidatus Cloacimonetes bacterium]|nr:hypothetical protein [Candidatus Cloacimonadota bacterium]
LRVSMLANWVARALSRAFMACLSYVAVGWKNRHCRRWARGKTSLRRFPRMPAGSGGHPGATFSLQH